MTDLPTPPTLEQRLDAAAEALRGVMNILTPRDAKWSDLPEDTRRYYTHEVWYVCRAFAPEHFKDSSNTTGKD